MQSSENPAPSAPEPAAAADTKGSRAKVWHNVAVRLADEGMPVRAIVRALLISYDEIREVLSDACARGTIMSVPRDDWPPGTRRDERQPDTVPLEIENENLTMLAMRTFKLTPAMAKMFVGMLRRPEMTKAALHLCIQRIQPGVDPTDMKIVDVFICKLRKKLPVEVKIWTLWGRGYFIEHDGKQAALKLLGIKHENIASPAGAGAAPTG